MREDCGRLDYAEKAVLCEKPFLCMYRKRSGCLQGAACGGHCARDGFEFRDIPRRGSFFMTASEAEVSEPSAAPIFRWLVRIMGDPHGCGKWKCDASQGGGILSALGVHLFDTAE